MPGAISSATQLHRAVFAGALLERARQASWSNPVSRERRILFSVAQRLFSLSRGRICTVYKALPVIGEFTQSGDSSPGVSTGPIYRPADRPSWIFALASTSGSFFTALTLAKYLWPRPPGQGGREAGSQAGHVHRTHDCVFR